MAKSFKITGLDKLDLVVRALNNFDKGKTSAKGLIAITTDTDLRDIDKLKARFPEALENAHRKTLVFVAEELEIALGLAMETNAWNWEYGDGNIVDTGALRDSVSIGITGDRINVSYGEEYAAIVYYGGYIHPYGNPRVQIYMPGRPWIAAVLNGGGPVEQFDIRRVYMQHFEGFMKAELSAIDAI